MPDELPHEAIRDLLGIVRALWAVAEQRGEAGRARMLQRAGEALKEALLLSRQCGASAQQVAAGRRTVLQAIECIAEASTWMQSLGEVMAAAETRARGGKVQRRDNLEQRLNRVKRGLWATFTEFSFPRQFATLTVALTSCS